MAQVGKYMQSVANGYTHWCPACGEAHYIAVREALSNGAQWTFNGDYEKPTFHPSVNIATRDPEEGTIERCHYFITDGEIRYCGDCTHDLAGQTVKLSEYYA